MRVFKRFVFMVFSVFTTVGLSQANSYNDRFIVERSPIIAFRNAFLLDGTGAEHCWAQAHKPNHTYMPC